MPSPISSGVCSLGDRSNPAAGSRVASEQAASASGLDVRRSLRLPELDPVALRVGDPAEPADAWHVLDLVRDIGARRPGAGRAWRPGRRPGSSASSVGRARRSSRCRGRTWQRRSGPAAAPRPRSRPVRARGSRGTRPSAWRGPSPGGSTHRSRARAPSRQDASSAGRRTPGVGGRPTVTPTRHNQTHTAGRVADLGGRRHGTDPKPGAEPKPERTFGVRPVPGS